MAPVYVVGHVNPDTDSIAAAMGYAWLLRERDGMDAVAARAGAVNPQTTWALKRLKLEAPLLLTDASPRFETVMRRYDTVAPDSPMRDAWTILNRTGGFAPVVNRDDGTPAGMITGLSLFNFLARHIGPQIRKQDVKLAEVLDMPCSEACDADVPRFTAATHIRDVLNRLLRLAYSEFVITDDKGLYLGVARQSEVLNPPRLQVILVDHNEPGQALGAIEEAQILEILDHHRLGNMPTRTPIKFSVDTVGSTSTLVSERIEEAGLSAPPPIAGMLLSGLLSDTLILTSPTTTERDRCAADRLGRWAFVKSGPLAGETIETYGRALVDAGAGLSTRKPEEIVSTDIKVYDAGGYKFLIAQVEVTDLRQLTEHLEALRSALDDLRNQRGLDFAMLMVTDVVDNISRLVLVNPPPMLDDLPYPLEADGTRLATGVVSRKKQLLPTVLGLLEA